MTPRWHSTRSRATATSGPAPESRSGALPIVLTGRQSAPDDEAEQRPRPEL